jgi:hypothetical protein
MPNEEQATMVIQGDPEAIQAILDLILMGADDADVQGLPDVADALAALIPEVRMLKAAQYEGAQGYWIANGRAFELAFKRNVEQGGENASFNDAWAKALDEWSESLLGGEDFGKRLKTAQYEGFRTHWLANSRAFELSFKKKVEEQGEDASFDKAWMDTLEEFQEGYERNEFASRHMRTAARNDDFLARVRAESVASGRPLPEVYREWEANHGECMRALLRKVASSVEGGKPPGVAFYESLDYFMSGAHERDVMTKVAGMVGDAWQWVKDRPGAMWDWLKGKTGDVLKGGYYSLPFMDAEGRKAALPVETAARGMKKAFDKMRKNFPERTGIHPVAVHQNLSSLMLALNDLYTKLNISQTKGGASAAPSGGQRGGSAMLPPLPLPSNYVDTSDGGISAKGLEKLEEDLEALVEIIPKQAETFDVHDYGPAGAPSTGGGEKMVEEIYKSMVSGLGEGAGRSDGYVRAGGERTEER